MEAIQVMTQIRLLVFLLLLLALSCSIFNREDKLLNYMHMPTSSQHES